MFCLSVPQPETFLCSSLCMCFLVARGGANKPVSSALLLHYFHPCLRMGQQFRIPEPSQTRSVLKRADATILVSPQIYTRFIISTPSHSYFGRTTGKSVCGPSSYAAVLFCSFYVLVVCLFTLDIFVCFCLFFLVHFSHHVVETQHTEFCLLAVLAAFVRH